MQPLFGVTLILVAMAGAAADDVEDSLQEANNQLTLKIFTEYAKVYQNRSFAMSAIHLMPALSLLAVASEGSTRDEIMSALGFKNEEILKKANVRAISKLEPAEYISMSVANRIFVPLKNKMDENFNKTYWDSFRTDVKNADYLNTTCIGYKMDTWINSKIGIYPSHMNKFIHSDTKALLVNALYFEGLWKKSFESNYNYSSFAYTNKFFSHAHVMFREDIFMYAENEELDAKILEIPYAGDEASFVIILPNKVDEALGALLQKVKDISILKEAFSKLQPVNVKVTIPHINSLALSMWHNDLTEVLKKIGVKKIFDSKTSEITKMVKERLHVSSVLQTVFVKVDERGLENDYKADASSKIEYEMVRLKKETKTFSATHTFAFLIKLRGIVLLSGMYRGETCYGMTYKDKSDGDCFVLDECCTYNEG